MRLVLILVFAACGCGFDRSATVGGDPLADDGGPDSEDASLFDADLTYACEKWSPVHFGACLVPQTGGDLVLVPFPSPVPYVFDTDLAELRDPDGTLVVTVNAPLATARGDAVIVVTENFTIENGAQLRVVGGPGLVIAARDTIRLLGNVDVSSSPGNRGAGGNPSICSATAAVEGDGIVDATGGGGGGFFGAGGAGGLNNDSDQQGGAGGAAVAVPTGVGGGCRGANGGGSSVSDPGPGGAGGGAVVFAAYREIVAGREIDAGGARGIGAGSGLAAGGGGGSGGLIGFDAPILTLTNAAVITANGGGGGQGADGSGGEDGTDGLRSTERAPGGDQDSRGGDGGTGGALEDPNGETPRNDPDGTGGGGGGAGYVIDFRGTASVDELAVVSPALIDYSAL